MTTYIQEIRQALAVTITDDDIRVLVGTTRRKALHNAAIAAELRAVPGNNGKACFSIKHHYSLYQFWRAILLGANHNEKPSVLPFISLDTSIHWLRIIFSTLDNHFSGEIAEVGKINALNYFNFFVQSTENDQPPASGTHDGQNYSITCAAQLLICCSLSFYLL